jgi:Skp family chaperone for outer membrane proteins
MKLSTQAVLLLAAIGGMTFAQPLQAQVKVGTIDMKYVFDNYYKTKEEEQKINDARVQAKKELDERVATLRKTGEEAQKFRDEANKVELSAAAKTEKGKQLNEKIQGFEAMKREVQEFQQTREKQLSEQSVRSRNTLVEEINKVISDKVKAAGYDLVLDKSGQSFNNVGVLIYSRESFDFTNEVAAELSKSKPKSDKK